MPKAIDIKFKNGTKIYYFDPNGLELNKGDEVVVETSRGIEVAMVVGEIIERSENQLVLPLSKIIRLANDKDHAILAEQEKKKPQVKDTTEKLIKKYKLDMKIVDVEFTLDNSKTIISFLCDERVDFRDLVKELASTLHQRIELRQIGVRDQAKLIGALGVCGKECCCKQYLNDFDKVCIKMAKTQGLSLNPTKINGVCGRLMCCLAYENDLYEEANKKMPKLNSFVETPDGVGQVVYNNILKETVSVKVENNGDIKMSDYAIADLKYNAPRPERENNTTNFSKNASEGRNPIHPKKDKVSLETKLNEINHVNSNASDKTNVADKITAPSINSKEESSDGQEPLNGSEKPNKEDFSNKPQTKNLSKFDRNKNNFHKNNFNNNKATNAVQKDTKSLNTNLKTQFDSGVVIHADDEMETTIASQNNTKNHFNKNHRFNGNRHFEKK